MCTTKTMTPCPKCYGARRFETFAHVEQGVCFRCGGAGVVDAASVTTIAAPAPATREAIKQLRHLYACARSQGEGWFTAGTYDTAPDVAFWCTGLDAAKRAQVLAAFDALGADAGWMARVG
jgi:hypothetical protein